MSEFGRDRSQAGLAARPEPREEARKPDLARLADQLNAIAASLRGGSSGDAGLLYNAQASAGQELRQALRASRKPIGPIADLDQRRTVYAELAREAYAKRRRRGTIFDNDELFGEPAWDILLDLYIAHAENKAVSVSSAYIGSAAPPTTGLRWLGVLGEQDLIVREHDPDDQRRVLVRLTERGLEAMDRYFAGAGFSS